MTSPMKIFIPTIGTQMRLVRDWSFTLYNDGRNSSLFAAFGIQGINTERWYQKAFPQTQIVLATGTLLQVDRVYIRQHMAAFDSISFYILDSSDPRTKPGKKGKKIRFWAKRVDVNEIVCDIEKE